MRIVQQGLDLAIAALLALASLAFYAAWSVPFTVVCSVVCYILGMLIWVMPYVK